MAKRTKEHCEKVARTCTTIKEFWSKCRSVATKAHKEGWNDSYTWLARERAKRNSLTKAECRAIAMTYSTLRDFRTKEVFVDPRGKQFPEDDTYRTVYFDFDWPHTPTELARDALGKRYPEIADRARMVELAAWGCGLTK